MSPGELEQADLTEGQRSVLAALARSSLSGDFYLSGGTALAAFYLRHRRSRDLFSSEDVPFETLRDFLASVPDTRVKSFQRLYDRRMFVIEVGAETLELEFTRYPFPRLQAAPRPPNAPPIDDVPGPPATKIAALADRQDPKDEVDLYFLVRSGAIESIAEAIELAEKKFGIPGLRYLLQRRMLAVSHGHPTTTPPHPPRTLVSTSA